jgi:putative flippase GtrA
LTAFLKFGALSGGGWVLDCLMLLALSQWIGVPLSLANVISSCIAAVSVFQLSRFVVFKPSSGRPTAMTTQYFLYTCAVIALASCLVDPAARICAAGAAAMTLTPTPGQIAFAAKVLITPPQLLCNFLVAKRLTQGRAKVAVNP